MANLNLSVITPKDYLFYIAIICIWGTTWLGITFQLGVVPPELSIAYRFLCASIILFLFLVVTKRNLLFPLHSHIYFVLLGMLLFSFNYFMQYIAIGYVVSGLVALSFTTVIIWNAVMHSWFFHEHLSVHQIIGAVIGMIGISLVFAPDIFFSATLSTQFIFGLILSVIAPIIASFGHMVSLKIQSLNIPVLQGNAFSMLYGSILLLLFGWIRHGTFTFDFSYSYVLSFVYLTIFGSVITFWLYLTLLGRIGPVRASYTTIMIPIVALVLSVFVEGYSFSLISGFGVLLCLTGNLFVLKQP